MVGNLLVDVNQRLFRCGSILKDVHDQAEKKRGGLIIEGGEGVDIPRRNPIEKGRPPTASIVQSGWGGVRQVPCRVIGFVSSRPCVHVIGSTPLASDESMIGGAASKTFPGSGGDGARGAPERPVRRRRPRSAGVREWASQRRPAALVVGTPRSGRPTARTTSLNLGSSRERVECRVHVEIESGGRPLFDGPFQPFAGGRAVVEAGQHHRETVIHRVAGARQGLEALQDAKASVLRPCSAKTYARAATASVEGAPPTDRSRVERWIARH